MAVKDWVLVTVSCFFGRVCCVVFSRSPEVDVDVLFSSTYDRFDYVDIKV